MNNYEKIALNQTDITGGFWAQKQAMNRNITLASVREQFEKTGRFAAFRFDWKEGEPDRPHIFWDSDVAKWLESAAYILAKDEDKALEAYVDAVVDLIEKSQDESGYFNIYFTVCEPDSRFENRMAHELYCAGHLMEAAVAYYEATGKDKFLKLMCRYADHIERVFKIEQSADFSTPGHEEIELALVRLWNCTGEPRYLELSRYFVDTRGTQNAKEVQDGENGTYVQDHLPVREQTTAEGHCVRAGYLYTAMADLSRETDDKALFSACRTLFENITQKRMYITGGIGSTSAGEAFTVDYDLPNATAYAETCAAISLFMFATRMTRVHADGIYADTAERALYNGVLAGISLDGKAFFYENPLEINLTDRALPQKAKNRYPITQRVEIFSCSCCPPNITRFIASLGENIYTRDENTVFVHHYIHSKATVSTGGKTLTIAQKTNYPSDGAVGFTLDNFGGKTLALRIPGWCTCYTIFIDGQTIAPPVREGYTYIACEKDSVSVELLMEMTPRWYEANGLVAECAGMAALTRGPVVYCAEGIDNGPALWSLRADIAAPVRVTAESFGGLPVLEADGQRKTDSGLSALYVPAGEGYEPCQLRFIPYYAFANRGETDMRVWLVKK